MNSAIQNSILSSLVCDTYVLGSHWVYDEKELQKLPIDWNSLNTAQSLWHKGKKAGDFTHYGDQTLFLLEYLKQNKSFNKESSYNFWKEKMSTYDGYIDGSSRESMQSMGASSEDLSICGRIAPLLLISSSKEEFLKSVAAFVSVTHNSQLALHASAFFAELLWMSQESSDLASLIKQLQAKYKIFAKWIDEAVEKKDADSFVTIREFGPACGINGGFAGVIYLLLQKKSFQEIMILNAKAGGDSSARGMIVAMILGVSKNIELPKKWLKGINKLQKINALLELF